MPFVQKVNHEAPRGMALQQMEGQRGTPVSADVTLDKQDLVLIGRAMEAYSDSLKKTLELPAAGLEDEMFVYGELRQVAEFLFGLMSNHSDERVREAMALLVEE